MATQLEFIARAGGESQCERILRYLQGRAGDWVAMPDLWRASGAFAVHSRVADLRRRGITIEHKNHWNNGKCYSFYRLSNPHASPI